MLFPHFITYDHYLLIITAFFPLLSRILFWLYVIQLKEYRWDRFKEYLTTPQGNSALINMWTVIEFPIFLVNFYVIFNELFEIILYPVVFYFFLIQNIFVLRKIQKKRLLKPKFTNRLLLTLSILIGLIISNLYLVNLFELSNYLYALLTFYLVFMPFIIFFIIIITEPYTSYKKNKIINKAIKISNTINEPIKIGVTGSYGKSTVKEFLASILEQEGKTLKTPENINTELGVSDLIIKRLNNTYKYFVAEMGAYKVGEIDILGKIVNHKYGFLTAIGNQHLGLFGSTENIKQGKLEIANSVLKNNGTLYINWNNQEIREIAFDKQLKVVKYGNFEGSDTKFEILGIKEGNTKFMFEYAGAKTIFFAPIHGEHNIINISGVLAFCYDMGYKTSDINKYIKNLKLPKNTLHVKKISDKFTIIDDSYNLSEAGLFAGIEVLNSFEGEKILVLDDILELGKESNNIHYNIGKKIGEKKLVNKIILLGVNYREQVKKGLIESGFSTENILYKYEKNIDKGIILYEGRNSGKFVPIINDNTNTKGEKLL